MRCPRCDSENPEGSRFCGNCATLLSQPEKTSGSQTQTFTGFKEDLERGSLFAGRFEVIEELGSGGMGKVYKVFDKTIQEVVALKLIRPELAARPKTLERFREEIRLARKITHKHVCRMHDLSQEQEIPYITMEYVPGEDLKSIIRMMGRLSPAQSIFIAKQVCLGLAEAHRLGIVHRDLKPKNIMIDREGNAKIMDFGLARSLEEKGITGGRVMLGTAEYMSPEQVEGKKAGPRSDLYSLGVILFEMVTGRLLFEGDSALSIAVKHKTEPPPDPRKINPEVSESLSRAILTCLEKNEERRYQSTDQLISVLEELEKEFPSGEKVLPQKKPSSLRELARPFRLRKVLIPALAVLAVLIILIWSPFGRKASRPLLSAKPSLAVLFFKNNTGDEGLDVWREALPENLIQELRGAAKSLTVIDADIIRTALDRLNLGRTASYSSEDLKDVAGKIGVSHILLGSYFKTQVRYELKDIHTGRITRDGRVEGKLEEEFQRITEDLVSKILADFNLPVKARATKVLTASGLANKYYWQGRQAETKYVDSGDTQDFLEATGWQKKALAEDPHFALPYWGLGDIYQKRYVDTKNPEDYEMMLSYYEKAYEVNPELAGANAGLGWAFFFKGDNDSAYKFFKRAFELEPENPTVNSNVASFYKSIGLPEQAVKYYTYAINQGEGSSSNHGLRATCFEHLGKYEEAVADSRGVFEREPADVGAELFYARMLISQKRLGEAGKEIGIAEKAAPDSADVRLTKALLLAAQGEKKTSLSLLKEAKKQPALYSYLLSRVYALAGLKNEALENIQLGIERGFQEIRDYLYEYPFLERSYFFDNLRDDPRFQEILKKQKDRYFENLEKYGGL